MRGVSGRSSPLEAARERLSRCPCGIWRRESRDDPGNDAAASGGSPAASRAPFERHYRRAPTVSLVGETTGWSARSDIVAVIAVMLTISLTEE